MRTSPPIERLVTSLKRLPGIGEKSATRLAFYLLGAAESTVSELSEAIGRLKRDIVLCEECFDLTDASPCALCRDEKRDPTSLCVVEEPSDLAAIERSRRFRGRYHQRRPLSHSYHPAGRRRQRRATTGGGARQPRSQVHRDRP